MVLHDLLRKLAWRLAPGYMADRARSYERALRQRLGVYEHEIRAPFEAAVQSGVTTFIDVGCADGYYAVGMPFASPRTACYAYDLAKSARTLCAATAAVNGVAHRVNISRRFSERSLPTVDLSGALVLCDIEGAEADLFTPTLVKRLVASTVVIEVHEDVRPGTGAALTRLFAPSHQVERLDQAASENSPATHENMRAPLLHWLIARPAGTSIRLRHSSGSV